MYKIIYLLLIALTCSVAFSQRGKDGDYILTGNVIVNTYTNLTATVSAGSSSIQVANAAMTGANFSGSLQTGDLILIYQVQGGLVDVNTLPYEWGWGTYTFQDSWFSNGNVNQFTEYGDVYNYQNAGVFEYAEVKSVTANTITVICPLKHSFYVVDNSKTQVIRVPRYKNLTVPLNDTIKAKNWDGVSGGVIAIEVEKDLNLAGAISATKSGFRGGNPTGNGNIAGSAGSVTDYGNRGFLGSTDQYEGAEKGESIYGNKADYDIIYSRYCYGSIANGGGGANYHNAGGGGGSNVGIGTFYGYGVPDRGAGNVYDAAWNLEDVNMKTTPSSGGGRGGYAHAEENKNPLTVGPHNSQWGVDFRRITGGVGGHPLTYDVERAFIGGGGGGGHQNNNYGGKGGAGGGAVFLSAYGNILGNGTIVTNGQNGGNSEGPTPGFSSKTGDDGAGGAGGAGAIVINNTKPIPASIKLIAKGGKGGIQNIQFGGSPTVKKQADGPGGGGAGGMISYTMGTPTEDVSGGKSGTTNSPYMNNFPQNGATDGASGLKTLPIQSIDFVVADDTICSGNTTTLVVTLGGNISYNLSNLQWFNSLTDVSPFATGNSYTTPALTVNTTYYIGDCSVLPIRIPVRVVVSPPIVIAGLPPTISNETCAGSDGSITGITVSGGTAPYTYSWNGTTTPGIDLTG
ncbi:MAG: SprB repeat-containing protein, partial [Brumimicrobium sp.]|nr:SprB repeat-containing protein [Brumimicrobium sp.]